jgi:hypothetical protein
MDSILASEKAYLDIAEKRNINYPYIEKALAIVQKFIREKHRILYGGMAIDLNLKSAGQPGIYAESAIPDYDIMSPNFYEDSLELADILHQAGLPGVSAINALHITGRRVRVNFVSVCDMSYIPLEIYNAIPTRTIQNLSKYKGLRVVSPDFQRLDLHRAFSHPYENAPQEVIRQRFAKDQKRFKLLDAQFPLLKEAKEAKGSKETKLGQSEPTLTEKSKDQKRFKLLDAQFPLLKEAKEAKGSKESKESKETKSPKPKASKSDTSFSWKEVEGQALTGFVAYAILRKYLEYLLAKDSSSSGMTIKIPDDKKKEMRVLLDKVPRHDIRFNENGFDLEWNLPMRPRISLLSTSYEDLLLRLNPLGGPFRHPQRYYNRYLDNLRPRAVRFFWFDHDHPDVAKSQTLEGDTYEMSRNVRETLRSFQELQKLHNLKVSMDIDKLAKDAEDLPAKMTPEDIDTWKDRLGTVWQGMQDDIEANGPAAQTAQRYVKSLAAVASGKMPKNIPEVEVLDVFGSLVPVFSVRDSFQVLGEMCKLREISPKVKAIPEKVWITQPQYLLMHFLVGAYERPKHAHVYREYYINTMRMIEIAEVLGMTLFADTPDVSSDPKAWAVYRHIPFFLGTQTLGTINQNYNLGYVASMRDKLLTIQGKSNNMNTLRPPFGYYPERAKPHQPFDPSGSPLFQLDGKRCSESQFDALAMKVVTPEVLESKVSDVINVEKSESPIEEAKSETEPAEEAKSETEPAEEAKSETEPAEEAKSGEDD